VQLCSAFLLEAWVPEHPSKSLHVSLYCFVLQDLWKTRADRTRCFRKRCAPQKILLLPWFPEPLLLHYPFEHCWASLKSFSNGLSPRKAFFLFFPEIFQS